jgi:hypothetical protein
VKIVRVLLIASATLALLLVSIPAAQQGMRSAYAAFRGWNFVPSITIVAAAGDPRVPLVGDAVAFWNNTFSELGTSFRLGAVTQVVGAIPVEELKMLSNAAGWPVLQISENIRRIDGNIVVALSDGELISFSARTIAKGKALVGIRDYRSFPLPNVARNVIAHELGHVIGLSHNADPTTLMCGRPAPCRPDLFASDRPMYFHLTDAEKADLQRMYPKSWQASP